MKTPVAPAMSPTKRDEAVRELIDSLPAKTVVTDPDLLAVQSRDRADIITPGAAIAAVLARTTDDVVTAVMWADRHGIPVVPRGAGSGLSGGATAVDGCLVVSVARMTSILEINPDNFTARVEPGVINADLNRAVAEFGLMYAPDPSSHEISSIGGNLATNAGGLRCVKYGVTRQHVREVTVVLPDGSVLTTGHQTVKGVAGLDLLGLFIGSEGTLGVITEAVVSLIPKPAGEPVTVMAGFPDVDSAMVAVAAAMRAGADPEMMEFMDQRTLRAIDAWKGTDFGDYAAMILSQTNGPEATRRAGLIQDCFTAAGVVDVLAAEDPAEGAQLIEIRRMAYPATERMGHMLTEDVCVPLTKLSDMMRAVDEIAKKHNVQVYTIGHAGDGNLHPSIVWTGGAVHEMPENVWAAATDMFRAAMALGGTVTGEHGIGTLKQAFLGEELGEVGTAVQRAVKEALDPKGLFNPGKALA
ncbi:FAD-binding oxidoreductase [Corynebacterium sputi]|uniref:FAD-binding oxidoreductase n=1 Tax=Corynebacterium sputi TaxID=489915 RepID=UPI001F0B6F8E|nr:FAD-linked oxidase C-terminal domain-containing protein [Corynebacterium sputi]